MKQVTFAVVLILWLAMIAGLVTLAADSAYSWSSVGMLEGVSQAEMAPYRFGGSPYRPGGACGPVFQGPPPFGGGFGMGPPPAPLMRPYPGAGLPGLPGCQ
jgi:hypothetical protein